VVHRQGAGEIFPEGPRVAGRVQAFPGRVRRDACRTVVLQMASVDRVPGNRSGVLEIFELFRAQPLDERCLEQQRQGGAPQAPRAEEERRREVSGE
jgi:hypothetical protein